MIVIEYQDIELDYCASCFGIWFDEGEIELLMEKVGIDPEKQPLALVRPETTITEARRRCPACSKLMEKVTTARQNVILDRCRHQHGLWFDPGEIHDALVFHGDAENISDQTTKAIADFLGEALVESSE